MLLGSVLSALTVAVSTLAAERLTNSSVPARSGSSEVIQLSDGAKLTFLGVTRGARHVAPRYENLGTGNWIYTGKDVTVVWIEAEHDPARWPSFQMLVSDKANTGCVAIEKRSSSRVKPGLDIFGFVLNAFPRWDKESVLRFRPFHGETVEGQFIMSNPEHGAVTNWLAEPMPITKSDGDFTVTLTNLTFGAPVPYWRGGKEPPKGPADQCVHLAFGFQQDGQSATNWHPRSANTSDAAGNLVQSVISRYPSNGIYFQPRPSVPPDNWDGYFYRPGLWPGVSAWKVRMEFTRNSGFNPDEILTLTNLPVRVGTQQDADDEWVMEASNTNGNFTAATVNGVQVKVLAPLQFPVAINGGRKAIRVLVFAEPNPTLQGMHLTLVEATDDQGKVVQNSFGIPWAGHFSIDFSEAGDVKTLNLKLALHKSRFVEFTVKPATQ